MVKLKLNKIFVVILSALFLLTGNITYSLSFNNCSTEECCQEVCCDETPGSLSSDIIYSEKDCCEYSQDYDIDTKPINLSNNSSNHITIIAKQLHANCIISTNPLLLPEKSLRQSSLHHSITILRI